eukprot:Pgem_evm1s374
MTQVHPQRSLSKRNSLRNSLRHKLTTKRKRSQTLNNVIPEENRERSDSCVSNFSVSTISSTISATSANSTSSTTSHNSIIREEQDTNINNTSDDNDDNNNKEILEEHIPEAIKKITNGKKYGCANCNV